MSARTPALTFERAEEVEKGVVGDLLGDSSDGAAALVLLLFLDGFDRDVLSLLPVDSAPAGTGQPSGPARQRGTQHGCARRALGGSAPTSDSQWNQARQVPPKARGAAVPARPAPSGVRPHAQAPGAAAASLPVTCAQTLKCASCHQPQVRRPRACRPLLPPVSPQRPPDVSTHTAKF